MKTCSQCKVEKPFGAFYRSKAESSGYQSSCIECGRLRRLELKKNPLMQLEKQIRSSVILENKLLKRENKKLCYICKEIFLIDDLLGEIICKDCNAKKTKEHYINNKENMIEYIKKNKGKIKEYHKEYKKKNKEKINANQRERRLKKKLEKQNNT